MAGDSRTAAQRIRATRQESMREMLAKRGQLQYVLEIVDKMTNASPEEFKENKERWKLLLDTYFRLIAKYLPDLKSVEHTGDLSDPVTALFEMIRDSNNPERERSDVRH